MKKPALLVVDDDLQVLAAVRRDLRSRYREHYTVMGAASGEEALDTLRALKSRDDALALLISDERMPGIPGHEVLAKSRDVYPSAKRVLLTAYSDIDAAIAAINKGHLDHYLSKPWDPPEDRLYPVVDELLDAWQIAYQPARTGPRLIGHQWSPRSHDIKDFLAGSLIPYRWMDLAHEPEARTLLDSVNVSVAELPVLVFEDGSVLRDPQPRQIAERLGVKLSASFEVYDLVIVGAGPAGLAAAVYGASEGLRTLLLDRHAPGGQAGTSSRIENYLGFPTGVSGSDLTSRALFQAKRLGAEFLAPLEVTGVSVEAGYKRLTLGDGRELVTRTMLAATGMIYREHPAPGMAEHSGAGVYYGAALTEAASCSDRRVFVVGGGNSAGQGAMHLARFAKEVTIVARRPLRETMSHYLIDQIGKTDIIKVLTRTGISRVEGDDRLERVALTSLDDGTCRVEDVDALFVFIGTRPHSEWLPGNVLRDDKCFVLTGRDLVAAEAFPRVWKETRDPLPLETSVPGIFAAGDVRAGAMNRVASAVGEGSMMVRLAHEYLALT